MFAIEKYKVKDNAEKVAKSMIQHQGNFRYIGSGSYGEVYGAEDSNVVYKIGDANNNVGYLGYIKVLAKQKTHNPYTPKVYGVRFINGCGTSHVFVVAMERLKPLPRNLHGVPDFFAEHLTRTGDGLSPTDKALGLTQGIPKPLRSALTIIRSAYTNANKGAHWSNSVDWDLHNGNFMMRDNQVVCIDPLA
jgi:hypothetical protein